MANSKALTYHKNIRSLLGTSEQKTLFHLRKILFQYVWVGYANQSIIARQDILKITVKDEKKRIMGELEHSIDNHEFDQAYVYLELGLEDVTR